MRLGRRTELNREEKQTIERDLVRGENKNCPESDYNIYSVNVTGIKKKTRRDLGFPRKFKVRARSILHVNEIAYARAHSQEIAPTKVYNTVKLLS